jgi:hypothetical protein
MDDFARCSMWRPFESDARILTTRQIRTVGEHMATKHNKVSGAKLKKAMHARRLLSCQAVSLRKKVKSRNQAIPTGLS